MKAPPAGMPKYDQRWNRVKCSMVTVPGRQKFVRALAILAIISCYQRQCARWLTCGHLPSSGNTETKHDYLN